MSSSFIPVPHRVYILKWESFFDLFFKRFTENAFMKIWGLRVKLGQFVRCTQISLTMELLMFFRCSYSIKCNKNEWVVCCVRFVQSNWFMDKTSDVMVNWHCVYVVVQIANCNLISWKLIRFYENSIALRDEQGGDFPILIWILVLNINVRYTVWP